MEVPSFGLRITESDIPANEQKRIFEKFYRSPIPENQAIAGTGIGLALVAHIVEAHGGTVQVQSKPGEGSTFSIRLPVQWQEQRMSLVLVVEDDPAILRGLKDILRAERFDVLAATDGETGYRFALDKKPDLVILDLMLPEMSGFEVCRKLRAEGFRADTDAHGARRRDGSRSGTRSRGR